MDYIKVIAGVILKDSKILIAKRKKGKTLENLWEFPGGKLESEETEKECLKRELKEEFNIETLVHSYLTESFYDYDKFRINLRAYLVQYLNGSFTLKDHQKIMWISVEEFSKFNFAPADIPICKFLEKYDF